MNERSIFLEALELTDPKQRKEYLDGVCGEDHELRSRIEDLLVSHAQANSFLEVPAAGLPATIACGDGDTRGELAAESLDFLEPSDKPGCLGTLLQYEVIEVIGRGGMGLVLRAYDTKLNRVVAIKLMAPELAANPMAVKRFLREARAAAAVSHDHVVTIHAIEEGNKPPFLVMEYVDGRSLREKIDRVGSLDLTEVLRIGAQTAQGLAAAHQQGLVHRDIKPANILLENGVERVKLTDFGLARAVDDVSVTQTGQIAGTPQFMSPEQAQGHSIDARSDLFSLGSVLYSMCTGRPPFRADTAVAVLRRVTDDDPRSIRELNSEVPGWLEAIVLKLLTKSADERFQTAEEVATLLNQHLAHRQNPTLNPMPAATAVPRKKTSSNGPRLETVVACLIIALFAIGAIAFFTTNRGTVVVESEVDGAQLSIHRLTQDSSEGSTRKLRWSYPGTKTTGSETLRLRSGAYIVFLDNDLGHELELSQKQFVVGRGGEIVIRVRRKETTPRSTSLSKNVIREIRHFGMHDKQVCSLATDKKGERVVTAAEDETYRVFEISTGRELLRVDRPTSENRQNADISPDGQLVAFGGDWETGIIEIWEVATKRRVRRIDAPAKSALVVAFSPDGQTLASAGKSRSVWLWDVRSGKKRLEMRGHDDTVCALNFSPDGSTLLSGSFDKSIRLWDIKRGRVLREFLGLGQHVRRIAFSPDGKHFVAASYIPMFFLFDIEKKNPIRLFRGHVSKPTSLVFSVDGRHLISGSPDKTVRVWETDTAAEVARFKSKTHSTNLVTFAGNTGHILTAGGWDMDNPTRAGDGDYSIHLRVLPDSIHSRASEFR